MRHLDDVTSADTGRRRIETISSVKSPFAKPQTLPARSRQRCTVGVSLLVANVAGLNLVRDVWSACSSRSRRRGGSRSCDHCAPNPNIRPLSRKALAQRKRRRWRKLADQRHRWIGRTTASAGRLKSCATNASSEGDVYGPIGSVLDVTGVLIRAVRLINRRRCAAPTHVDRARRVQST